MSPTIEKRTRNGCVFSFPQEKKMAGKVSMGVVRTTFIIDEEGIITAIMPRVKPDTNAAEVLEALS